MLYGFDVLAASKIHFQGIDRSSRICLAEPPRLRRRLHLLDKRAEQLSRREGSRQRRTLARPLRPVAGLTLSLRGGVEGLARIIGHRISGNLTSGHVCDQGGETVSKAAR